MSSYHKLHLYMIENYKGMLTDDGKIHFSEDTLRCNMPKHIKKAGNRYRYKQMCGCQYCVICKDMHQNLNLWRKRYTKPKQQKIDRMQAKPRLRTTKTEQLASYKLKVMDNHDNMHPERAWAASAQLACEKNNIGSTGANGVCDVKGFHQFGCGKGDCNQCPKWNTIIPEEELLCADDVFMLLIISVVSTARCLLRRMRWKYNIAWNVNVIYTLMRMQRKNHKCRRNTYNSRNQRR
jgi:hypothetical protein